MMSHRHLVLRILASGCLVAVVGCGDDSTGTNDNLNNANPVCGNGSQEGTEECDGADLGGETCQSQGLPGGTLNCYGNCTFDTTQCDPPVTCDNGAVDPPQEQCDGADLAGHTCQSLGLGVGTLACASNCQFDLSLCESTPICGNSQLDTGEQCDDTILAGEDCVSLGYASGTLACGLTCQFDESQCVPAVDCGNGQIDTGEQCDGSNLNSQTCQSQGLDGGTLACTGGCLFDTTSCFDCGDGARNGTEECDTTDFGTATCNTEASHTGGTLTCTASCTIEASGCYTCGDSQLDGPEVCDGANTGTETCLTQASLAEGTLTCASSCLAFDPTDCHDCGNGTREGPETCDTSDFGTATCSSEAGLSDGTLICLGDCSINTSNCYQCGNGTIEGPEVCDTNNVGSETCQTQAGLPDGTLTCESSCLTFNDSDCHVCGDGIVEGPEVCDGTDFGALSCLSETGVPDGNLTCLAGCLSISSGDCHDCGDGVRDGPEACDGNDLGGATCESLGNYGGTLECAADCSLNDSQCIPGFCGDGIVQATFEVCDGLAPWGEFNGKQCSSCTEGHWVTQFGTWNEDSAHGVDSDGAGSTYLVGITGGDLQSPNLGAYDCFLRKYDQDGNTVWLEQYGTAEDDYAFSVAVDGTSGDIYIGGVTRGALQGGNAGIFDAYVRKYSDDGQVYWTRQFGTAGEDYCRGVAVDDSGSVFVVGYTPGVLGAANLGSTDAYIRKYNSSGTEQWTRQFGTAGGDSAQSVTVDATGNTYVIGIVSGALQGPYLGAGDAYLRVYDTTGAEIWTRQFGTAELDTAMSVNVNSVGEIYVVGGTLGMLGGPPQGNFDCYVRKYDQSGNVLWTIQFGTSEDESCYTATLDSNGDLYVAGFTRGDLVSTVQGTQDAFVRKIDPSGVELWTRQVGTSQSEMFRDVHASNPDELLLPGDTNGLLGGPNQGYGDAFLYRIVMQ